MKSCSGFSVATFRLFLLWIFMHVASPVGLAQEKDALVYQYDINDPRNPKCPCHDYQKKAEKEFLKTQIKQINQSESLVQNRKKKKKYSAYQFIKKDKELIKKKKKINSGKKRRKPFRCSSLFFHRDIAACETF